jgi:hypothetical protein
MSYTFTLWPGLQYGLATLATTSSHLEGQLRRLDYEALSLLGVNPNIKREWRTIPHKFGGIGLRSLEVEQTIGWINIILQHFGVASKLGQNCRASLEAMQLELGCLGTPLFESFRQLGHLAASVGGRPSGND